MAASARGPINRAAFGFGQLRLSWTGVLLAMVLALTKCSPTTGTVSPVILGVSVSASPSSLTAGDTAKLTAIVTGSGAFDGTVTWAISAGDGSLSANTGSSVTYTAADVTAPVSVQVTATSNGDSSKTGTVTLAVVPKVVGLVTGVDVSASLYSLGPSGTATLTAAVSGTGSFDNSVSWLVASGGGSLSSSTGASVTYTAPSAISVVETTVIEATSVANPSVQGSITLGLAPPGSAVSAVTASANPMTLSSGGTSSLSAVVAGTGSFSPEVAWTVISGGGSLSAGSGATVTYTAPTTDVTLSAVVEAASVQDPSKSAQVTLTIAAASVLVSVSPSSVSVQTGVGQQFSATVTGTSNTGVNWSVVEAGGGTVSSSGLYTAPGAAGTYHVKATSVADSSKSAQATVTVTTIAQPITVSLSPTSASLLTGANQQFSATVTGSSNSAVTWSVLEAGGGTVNGTGLYTAPASAGAYHVKATSVADATKSAQSTVTVTAPVTVSISPLTATLPAGTSQQFTATVTGTANTAVTWLVVEAGGGTVTTAGLYTAPGAPGTFHVRATSVVDGSEAAQATVTVTPPVSVSVLPATASLPVSTSQQFTATVTGTSNTAVTWSVVEGGGGTVNGSGLYMAPAVPGAYHVKATSLADSSKSGQATASVLPAGPGPVTLLRAAPGDQRVTVLWEVPSRSTGALSYTVTVSPMASGAEVTVSGKRAYVRGLVNGTQYTLTVTAHDTTGTGPGSSATATPNCFVLGMPLLPTLPRPYLQGSPTGITSYGYEGKGATRMASGDIDGDGTLDVVVVDWQVETYLGNGDGTFRLAQQLPACPGTARPVLADLNGDGRLDVIVFCANLWRWTAPDSFTGLSTWPGPYIRVFLNNGNGTLTESAQPELPSTMLGASSGFAVDMDGDSIPDLVFMNVSQTAPNTLPLQVPTMMHGHGDGTFSAPQDVISYATFGASTLVPWQFLAVGDLNNDGKPDVAVLAVSSSKVSGLVVTSAIGDGHGHFSLLPPPTPATTSSEEFASDFVLGDFSGTGQLDAAISLVGDWLLDGALSNATLRIVLGAADGTLAGALPINADGAIQYDGAFLHVVRAPDGKHDLVAWSRSTLQAGTAQGAIQFADKVTATAVVLEDIQLRLPPSDMLVGDFDGDGLPDLLYVAEDPTEVYASPQYGAYGRPGILRGLGSLSWEAPVASLAPISGYAIVADLTGDGIGEFFGTGSPNFPFEVETSVGLAPCNGAFVLGDFNEDGITDIAAVQTTTPFQTGNGGPGTPGVTCPLMTAVREAPPSFNFEATVSSSSWKTGLLAGQQSGDVNGDGFADVFILEEAKYSLGATGIRSVSSYLGDGTGRFGSSIITEFADTSLTSDSAFFDANEDGRVDALLVAADQSWRLMLGNPDGTFTIGTRHSFGNPAPLTNLYETSTLPVIAFGDFNEDGHIDFVLLELLANTSPVTGDKAHIFLGDGKGNFTETQVLQLPFLTNGIRTADLNGDGHLDVIGAAWTAPVFVLFGDGAGNLAPLVTYDIALPPTSAGAGHGNAGSTLWGIDVTGDGQPDFLIGAGGTLQLQGTLAHSSGRMCIR